MFECAANRLLEHAFLLDVRVLCVLETVGREDILMLVLYYCRFGGGGHIPYIRQLSLSLVGVLLRLGGISIFVSCSIECYWFRINVD